MCNNMKRKKLIEAARAYYLENHTQSEIARDLGISRSQVSRYLSDAREQGIVLIRIIDEDQQQSNIGGELKIRYPHLRLVEVAPTFEPSISTVRASIGRYGANFLIKVLQPGQKITLGCGRTLEAMVKALPEKKIEQVSIAQGMGNLGHEAHGIDYNEIARVAASKLGARGYYVSAPAILGEGSGFAIDFLSSNPMLKTALDFASKADFFMVGVGSMESDQIYTRFGLVQEHELQELKGRVVGDIFGHFFDINGQEIPTAFEKRVIGIKLQDMCIAQYAIALAGGVDKVAPLLGAIRGHWINGIISDEQTIHSILALDDTYQDLPNRKN